jgi:hydroxymethylbilane synthase
MVAFPAHAVGHAPRIHAAPRDGAMVRPHAPALPLRVGTRGSALALWQTRDFLALITRFCPVLREFEAFREHVIATSGDLIQDRRLSEIGGKGLFAKEIHEALLERRVDFAVHSLKDLETDLPPGIVLACTLKREDARDALILGAGIERAVSPDDPFGCLPAAALVGTCSTRRQAQILARRPDLRTAMLRGNVATRLSRVRGGDMDATVLALAGLRRLGLEHEADVVVEPEVMVPAACQGIVGVTVRADDTELHELLSAIEDITSRAIATAERALLAALDGSCRTPIGGHAVITPDRQLRLTGLVAREDGSFILRRTWTGSVRDAARLGAELGESLRRDSPADIFEGCRSPAQRARAALHATA